MSTMLDKLLIRSKDLKYNLCAVYYAYKDKRVGLIPKIAIFIGITYALSPIDLIPDFIPILGYLDDLIIVPALLGLAIRLIPKDVYESAKEKAKAEPIKLKEKWFFAIIFILVWAYLIYKIVDAIIRI